MTARYACSICGKKITAEKSIYSKHLRQRYCRDLEACARRRKKKPTT